MLDRFTNYRQEWRNPAAHDHTLDFDEDEALIAITSVTVFAIVLTDQIIGKVAFDAAASATPSHELSLKEMSASLHDLITEKIYAFACNHTLHTEGERSIMNVYEEFEGAVAGYLSSELTGLGDVKVELGMRLAGREADIVVSRGSEKVVVELKLISDSARSKQYVDRAVTYVARHLHEKDVVGAIVLVYSRAGGGEYAVSSAPGGLSTSVRIISK